SLAAAIVVIRELRARNVHQHLWRIGRRLREGLTAAAERADLPFQCRGFDPMMMMSFHPAALDPASRPRDPNIDLAWEYILQEMAARGVLMNRGGANFISFAHGDSEIDAVVGAAGDVFSGLRKLWDTPKLAEAVQARKQTAFG